MLRLEHVSVAYGKHEALHDVTLDVPAGRTTVILGANGAGKTTLLKTIAGLVRPQPGGRILFEGRAIEDEPPHRDRGRRHRPGARRPPPVRRHDGHRQPAHRRLHAARAGQRGAPAREAARAVPAPGRAPQPARQDHERRRAADAGDRPRADVGAEDPAARRAVARPGPRLVKDLFATLRTITERGQSIVLVEQNVHQSLRLADRVYVLENGRIVRSGSAAEIQKDTAIQQAYLGLSPTSAPAAAARRAGSARSREDLLTHSRVPLRRAQPARPSDEEQAMAAGRKHGRQRVLPPLRPLGVDAARNASARRQRRAARQRARAAPRARSAIPTSGGFVNPHARTPSSSA